MELLYGGVSYPVPSEGGNLGSGDGAWLRIHGTGVLPEHARVGVEPEGLVILPAAAGALVLVNGAPVGPEARALADGDRIALGSETVIVTGEAAPASARPPRHAPPPGAAQQLADTLAGVPSFRPPPMPLPGSIREAGGAPRGGRTPGGNPPSGAGRLLWGAVAVVLLGVVLYMLMGR